MQGHNFMHSNNLLPHEKAYYLECLIRYQILKDNTDKIYVKN